MFLASLPSSVRKVKPKRDFDISVIKLLLFRSWAMDITAQFWGGLTVKELRGGPGDSRRFRSCSVTPERAWQAHSVLLHRGIHITMATSPLGASPNHT